jgi:hypothetical protein
MTQTYSKEDIIEGFKFRHATKVFDATKTISDADTFYLETAHFVTKFFWF